MGTGPTGGVVVGTCHRDSDPAGGAPGRAGFPASGKWALTRDRPSVGLGGARIALLRAPAEAMNCLENGCYARELLPSSPGSG